MELVKHPAFVPALSVALNLASVIRYAAVGDAARVVYWGCAAALTATVTWWIR